MRRLLALLALPLLAFTDKPYREALPGYQFSFPRDHFEHPEFRTEWWYYTGNVWTTHGQRFGFELVFFRQANRVGARDNSSPWRIDDLYLAHAALTDITGKHFVSHERLNRAGPGIAGANFATQRIWNGNWSDTWSGEQQHLVALTEDFAFDLRCSPAKPLVIQGENGVNHGSHYVSFPRLHVEGSLSASGRSYKVAGQAWMDHEWFTNKLDQNQIGWDWFSVQLDNNTELMLYQFRRKDGERDPFSSGSFVASDGQARHLSAADFTLQPLKYWSRYPVAWSIAIPSLHLQLECRATLPDQELTGQSEGTKYWEGAVDYTGSEKGVGYLEMTGYDRPMTLR